MLCLWLCIFVGAVVGYFFIGKSESKRISKEVQDTAYSKIRVCITKTANGSTIGESGGAFYHLPENEFFSGDVVTLCRTEDGVEAFSEEKLRRILSSKLKDKAADKGFWLMLCLILVLFPIGGFRHENAFWFLLCYVVFVLAGFISFILTLILTV